MREKHASQGREAVKQASHSCSQLLLLSLSLLLPLSLYCYFLAFIFCSRLFPFLSLTSQPLLVSLSFHTYLSFPCSLNFHPQSQVSSNLSIPTWVPFLPILLPFSLPACVRIIHTVHSPSHLM